MRVLVTGASGFLGRALVAALQRSGHEVRAVVRSAPPVGRVPHPAEIVLGDVTRPASLAAVVDGIEAVYHCAAVTEPGPHAASMVEVNVLGTRHLLAAARAAGVRRFVHASSAAAVGGWPPGRVYDEADPYGFGYLASPYHDSKAAAEREVWRAVEGGLDAVMLNPVIILDPGDREGRRSTRLMRQVARSGGWLYPAGGLSLTTLERVVEAFVAALAHGRAGARYVLAGPNVTFRALLQAVAARHGTRVPRVPIGRGVMTGVAAVSTLLRLAVGRPVGWTMSQARGFGLVAWYDSSRAVRELGYRPPSLDEVLDALG